MSAKAQTVEAVRAINLGGLPHGFLGRRGGVSVGEVAGLNVGYGSKDDRAAIFENRKRAVAAVLPGAQLATVHQVHSAEAVYAGAPWPDDARPRPTLWSPTGRASLWESSPPTARRSCSPMPRQR